MLLTALEEWSIIRSLFPPGKAPSDDCFFYPPHTLLTTDSLAEGTHFRRDWSSPKQIAEKLVEVNVSDIVASGGEPTLALLNLGLSPETQNLSWIQSFRKAFLKRLGVYKIILAGGDTFASQTLQLSMTLLGKTKKPWLRTGAKPGDILYLSGEIGPSQFGWELLKTKALAQNSWEKKALQKHLSPVSRLSLGKFLRKFRIHSCMDMTDGLLQDSIKLAEASKVRLDIHLSQLPCHKRLPSEKGWDFVLTSGEELELFFSSPNEIPLKYKGLPITAIGQVSRGTGVRFWEEKGNLYVPKEQGFRHFT